VAETPTPTPTGAGAAARNRTSSGTLLRSSSVMAAGTALSRVLGLVRAAVLVAVIGGTLPAANAFSYANTVPNNLYLLIAGGVLNAVLVPQVVRAMARPDGGAEYLDRLVTAAVLFFAVVTAVLVLAAPVIVRAIAYDYSGPQRALTVAFAAWCLPQVFFYGLYTLLGQILNARGSFGPYMWAPVVNNVVALLGLGAFVLAFGAQGTTGTAVAPGSWTSGQVALLAGTATLGVATQAVVLLVPLRRAGVRLRPRLGLRGMGLRSAGRTAGWTFAALVVGQVGFLAVTNVAASVDAEGGTGDPGYAAWGLAYLTFMLPHSLVAVSVVTALFTRMSRSAVAGDAAAVRADVSHGARTIGVASVLATAGLVVLSGAAGVVIAGTDPEQGRAVGRVIAAMALGLVPFSASYLLQRAFYAFEDARTPFVVQCVAITVWAAGALLSGLLLAPADRVVGVAAAMVCGQVAGASFAAVRLHRRLGSLDGRRVLRTHVRLAVAGLAAALAGLAVAVPMDGLLDSGRAGGLVVAVVAGGVVVAVYAAGLRLLHVEEVQPLLGRLTRR